jgi:hypothetical protein
MSLEALKKANEVGVSCTSNADKPLAVLMSVRRLLLIRMFSLEVVITLFLVYSFLNELGCTCCRKHVEGMSGEYMVEVQGGADCQTCISNSQHHDSPPTSTLHRHVSLHRRSCPFQQFIT